MKLKDYNKRRKLRLGGDPELPWKSQIRNASGRFGQKVYQAPWSPRVPDTRLGNGLKTLNPLTDPLERVKKLSDVGQELTRRKNITTGIRSIRPKAPTSSILGNLGKLASKASLPISIGVPTGIALGEAITGEDLGDRYDEWRDSRDNLESSIENRKAAERELRAIKEIYGDPNWKENLNDYNSFISNANNAGMGNFPAEWSFMQEHDGVPSPDKEPPSNNVINAEKKGGKGSSNNTKATNSSTDYKFLDDSKIKRQSVTDVKLSEPSKTVNTSPVKVKNVPRPSSKSSSGIGIGEIALQFLPDLINLGTGLFGKDNTLPKTKVSKAAVVNMPSRFNVNPQLEKNSASYRAILSDPNATMNQKLAALVSKHRADSEVLANKENIERQMEANKAALEANLDSQQARYDEKFREDKMMSDANLGLTGNFARSSLANMSQKGLGLIAQRNQRRQDDIALAAILAGVDEATRNRILEAIKNAK